MIAIAITEWINIQIFSDQTAPVVYLNGALLFVAGVAMLQAHYSWRRNWSVLVTLAGWIIAGLGLLRMLIPEATQLGPGLIADAVFAAIGLCGALLCLKGYGRSRTE